MRTGAAPGSRLRGTAGRSPGPGRRPPAGGVRRPARLAAPATTPRRSPGSPAPPRADRCRARCPPRTARGGQEPGLLDDAGPVTAPPGQRQLQRPDRHPQAALALRQRRPGVRLGDRQVGGRLVQAPLSKVTHRAHQGQLRVVRARREGPHQRLHGLRLPVERQAERMVGQQLGRLWPVAGRLGVPDGLGRLAVLGEPPGGAPVQRGYFRRQCTAQLQPEQIGEQVVVAEPGASRVERFDERVRVLQLQQDLFRARAAGQQVGQLAVDPIQQAGAQQQILDLRAADGPASRRSGTRRPCGRCRRTPRRTAPGQGGRPGRAPRAAGPWVTPPRASASSDSTRPAIAGALKSGVAAGGSVRLAVAEA
jgi:hypothetical protein